MDSARKRRTVGLVGALTSIVVVLSSLNASTDALEPAWPSSINSAAKNININKNQSLFVSYPAPWDTKPGAGQNPHPGGPNADAFDDFCASRTYANAQCNSGTGHAGVDIIPASWIPYGEVPIVAARDGTVKVSTCSSGSGRNVQVLGSDARWYHYLHLASTVVSVNASVKAGQLLGYMGNSDSSSCAGSIGVHLHFEVREGGNNRAVNAVDPYLTLRRRFSWIGRLTTGNQMTAFFDAWLYAVGPYVNAGVDDQKRYVGWPNTLNGLTGSNVGLAVSSDGSQGYKQYLAVGHSLYSSNSIGAVIIKPNYSSYAFHVPREVYTTYASAGAEAGFLGFPTGNFIFSTNVQRYQGGCIGIAGGVFVAKPYGQYPCPSSH